MQRRRCGEENRKNRGQGDTKVREMHGDPLFPDEDGPYARMPRFGGKAMSHVREMEALRERPVRGSHATRRRYLYFGLASLGGYGLGILVLAAALSRGSSRVELDGEIALWLSLGALVGLAGGAVVAGAYREARRRHS